MAQGIGVVDAGHREQYPGALIEDALGAVQAGIPVLDVAADISVEVDQGALLVARDPG